MPTVKELSERIDQLEKSVNEVDDKTNQLSKDIVTNTRFNIELKEIRNTFSDIDKAVNEERITVKVFFISVIFVSLLSFAFGCVVGNWYCIKFGGETKTTVTTTETTTSVKPNKSNDLKKAVESVPVADRKKLSECIENALETEATEAYEIREELHDQIRVTFDDAEEKVWIPFRRWIESQQPADTVAETKKIYKTIQEALNVTFKQSW